MKFFRFDQIQLAAADLGAGPTVLLVHGFPLESSMWQSQAKALVEAGFRTVVPDLRGYGQSTLASGDAAAGVDMWRYADDLAELLAAIGIDEPIVFVGFSMGGYIAWEFLSKYRELVDRLVLCDTRAAADSQEAAANRLKMADLVDTWGSRHVADLLIPKLFADATIQRQPELVEPVRRMITDSPTAAIAAAQRGMARRRDFSLQLATFDVPTLALGGAHDAISPPAEMAAMAAAMPQAEFVEISGAGHMAPIENAAAVNRALVDFLA
jgi:pimeloyl-ACP methyl ester carboxylesterase